MRRAEFATSLLRIGLTYDVMNGTSVEFEWLLGAADRLASLGQVPLVMTSLLRRLGIDLRVVEGLGPTTLTKPSDRSYRIVLARSRPSSQELSRRERFTIAHEIGHVLVDHRLGYRPTNERAYHQLETWCDSFAGRLLVPDSSLAQLNVQSWRELAQVLEKVADAHEVSYAVAARRLVERYKSLALARLDSVKNKAGESVLKVKWVAGDARFLGVQLHCHITRRHVLSRLLGGASRDPTLVVQLPDVGRVKVHILRRRPGSMLLGARHPGAHGEQGSLTHQSA